MRVSACLLIVGMSISGCAATVGPVHRGVATMECGPVGGTEFHVRFGDEARVCGHRAAGVDLTLGVALPLTTQRVERVSGVRSRDGGSVNVSRGVVEIFDVTGSDFAMTWSLEFADGTIDQGEARVTRCPVAGWRCL